MPADEVFETCTICSMECDPEPLVDMMATLRGGVAGGWSFCSFHCLRYWVNDELPNYFDSPEECRPYD